MDLSRLNARQSEIFKGFRRKVPIATLIKSQYSKMRVFTCCCYLKVDVELQVLKVLIQTF